MLNPIAQTNVVSFAYSTYGCVVGASMLYVKTRSVIGIRLLYCKFEP